MVTGVQTCALPISACWINKELPGQLRGPARAQRNGDGLSTAGESEKYGACFDDAEIQERGIVHEQKNEKYPSDHSGGPSCSDAFKFCGVVRDKSQLGSQDPGRLGSSV